MSIELRVIPSAAAAQITPKINQPKTGNDSRIGPSVMGVYVPAIRKNIEQWSSTWNTFFEIVFGDNP